MDWKRCFKHWRKGIPKRPAANLESLRASLEGKTLLVLGNGLSAPQGLEYAQKLYDQELFIIGMNASGKLITPHYYLFIDAKAFLKYLALINPEHSRVILSTNAPHKIDYKLRKQSPELYAHAQAICSHPQSLHLPRDMKHQQKSIDQKIRSFATCNTAGGVALQLALFMLLPPLSDNGSWLHSPQKGELLITGLDGYQADHVCHIDRNPIDSERARVSNLEQEAIMEEVFELAETSGLKITNLCNPKVLKVNTRNRDKIFDQEFLRDL